MDLSVRQLGKLNNIIAKWEKLNKKREKPQDMHNPNVLLLNLEFDRVRSQVACFWAWIEMHTFSINKNTRTHLW